MVFGMAARRLQELRLPIVVLKEECIPRKEDVLTCLSLSAEYITRVTDAEKAVQHLLTCDCCLGLDIETYPLPGLEKDLEAGLAPRKSAIRLVQIYDGTSRVFVFDLLLLQGVDVLGKPIWEKPMIAHNAIFEMKHLIHKGILPKQLGCTLLVDRVINGNRLKLKPELGLSTTAGLKDLSKEILALEVSKAEQTSDWSAALLTPAQIEYAALDAVLPVKIFQNQRKLLKERGLVRSYEILRDAQHAVAKIELAGIRFDVEKHKQQIVGWDIESQRLKEEILEALGKTLNLNSSKQVGEWLQESLEENDLETWIKTAGGKLSTSTPTFKLKEACHAMFPKMIEYRQVAKKISSFGKGLYKFIDPMTNRLHGSFFLGTTVTGRMASQKPNLQNMPRTGFRDLFIASEGHLLVGLDYSQQELRVAALVTNDEALLQIYKNGGDVHTNTAAAILGVPKESVTKAQRQLAKAVIFGLLYGQGAKGLSSYARQQYGVDMTEQEAECHRKALFKTYRGLRRWQQNTGELVKVTGVIRTQSGRIRDFNREQNGYRFTAALNHPIQGAAAEITLRAITRLAPMLCEECRLVNVIHDEILLEVIENRAQEIAYQARISMEAAFLDVFPTALPYLKGLVEAKVGKNWVETKQ